MVSFIICIHSARLWAISLLEIATCLLISITQIIFSSQTLRSLSLYRKYKLTTHMIYHSSTTQNLTPLFNILKLYFRTIHRNTNPMSWLDLHLIAFTTQIESCLVHEVNQRKWEASSLGKHNHIIMKLILNMEAWDSKINQSNIDFTDSFLFRKI